MKTPLILSIALAYCTLNYGMRLQSENSKLIIPLTFENQTTEGIDVHFQNRMRRRIFPKSELRLPIALFPNRNPCEFLQATLNLSVAEQSCEPLIVLTYSIKDKYAEISMPAQKNAKINFEDGKWPDVSARAIFKTIFINKLNQAEIESDVIVKKETE